MCVNPPTAWSDEVDFPVKEREGPASSNDAVETMQPPRRWKAPRLGHSFSRAREWFGGGVPLRSITPEAASDWRAAMLADGLSEATVRCHTRNLKSAFTEAARRKLVEDNPFSHLRSASIASVAQDHYVSPGDTERLLKACPNEQWRLLIVLARYCGLRCPSETHTLRWPDVDWDQGRMRVWASKTERERTVPLEPRAQRELAAAFAQVEPGAEGVITLSSSKGNLARDLKKVIGAAGLNRWPKIWQSLRASCEREWATRYPQHAVSRWIGHRVEVSDRHYLGEVLDHVFDRAAGWKEQEEVVAQGGCSTAPNDADSGRNDATLVGVGPQENPASAPLCGDLRGLANEADGTRTRNHRIDSPGL